MLVAQNLSKKYGQLSVLNNVSLSIKDRAFISIVGPSGAGKSTLLHLLSALDQPDAGSVAIDNINIASLAAKEQAKYRNENFGFVFQFHHLLPEFTAVENVAMPLWIAGKAKNEATKLAKEAIIQVGLQHRLNHKPNELSGGEQQRIAIARAIVHKPKYLFADEPTGNLDTANATIIHELFQKIHKQNNITVIIVTHNESLALLAQQTYTMRDGQIESIKNNESNATTN